MKKFFVANRAFALSPIALTALALSSLATVSAAEGATPATSFRVGEKVVPLLDKYCFSCHDADVQKGDIEAAKDHPPLRSVTSTSRKTNPSK